MLKRKEYIRKIIPFIDKDVIKVYIDSRKPYLLKPYKE